MELAEKDLELAKQTLENSSAIFSGSLLSSAEKVAQAEKGLDAARNNFTSSKKLLGVQRESLYKNAQNSMSNAFIITRNARDFTDETFGITTENRTKDDVFENYLGAKDPAARAQVEKSFSAFNAEYATMYTWYYANIVGKTDVSKETLQE